jgi:hypothetical protein
VVCSFPFLLHLPRARSAKNWNELGEIGDALILIQQKIIVVCLQSWWLLFARLYGWTTTPPSPLLLVSSETEWCGSSQSCSVDLIVVDWMMLHVARVKEVHYGGRRGECYCRSYHCFAGAIISGSILSAHCGGGGVSIELVLLVKASLKSFEVRYFLTNTYDSFSYIPIWRYPG